jgi:hypothetical protein
MYQDDELIFTMKQGDRFCELLVSREVLRAYAQRRRNELKNLTLLGTAYRAERSGRCGPRKSEERCSHV